MPRDPLAGREPLAGRLVLKAARRHVWLAGPPATERLRVRGGERLVPGDRVEVAADGGVDAPLPRRNWLRRNSPRGERLLAANLDALGILMAARTRDGGEGFIARCLAAAFAEGIEPLLLFNKSDLDEEGTLQCRAAESEARGIKSLVFSVSSAAGLEPLTAVLAARCVALVGFSGVGKSSLINALQGERLLEVGAVDSKGRGRHTTTLGEAIPWSVDEGTRGLLIDLPGVRSFGLIDLDALYKVFPKISAAAQRCRFPDCGHQSEPDCAVLAEIAEGTIKAERLTLWREIQENHAEGEEGRW